MEPPAILRLLSDPVRWQLVVELGRSDRRVGELVELTEKPQNLVSYHLKELRDAGIVTAHRSSADGRDVYYRADVFRSRDLLAAAGVALHPPVSPTRARPRLLFLCTGNSARSQMAEAFVEHRSAGQVHARSAGSHPKQLHPNAVKVMAGRGIDIAGRPTKSLTKIVNSRFDRVITLCDKVREVCPDFPGKPITAHWSIADPAAAGDMAAFRRAADDIEGRVALLLDDLQERTRHVSR